MSDLPHTSQKPDSSQIREVSLSRLREAVDAYGEMVHPDDVRYLLMDGQAAVLASGCKAILSAPTIPWCEAHDSKWVSAPGIHEGCGWGNPLKPCRQADGVVALVPVEDQ